MCPCGDVNGVSPVLITPNVGCEACDAYLNYSEAEFVEGAYTGWLVFGPNMVGGIVNEKGIMGYRIHVTDINGIILGTTCPTRKAKTSSRIVACQKLIGSG